MVIFLNLILLKLLITNLHYFLISLINSKQNIDIKINNF